MVSEERSKSLAQSSPDNTLFVGRFSQSCSSFPCRSPIWRMVARLAEVKLTHPLHAYQGFVILELKFTHRFPNWFREHLRAGDDRPALVRGDQGLGLRLSGK